MSSVVGPVAIGPVDILTTSDAGMPAPRTTIWLSSNPKGLPSCVA